MNEKYYREIQRTTNDFRGIQGLQQITQVIIHNLYEKLQSEPPVTEYKNL